MSDRPTPETDAEVNELVTSTTYNMVTADFARKLERERDRYKTALEGIAGFPHQCFDTETPWRMRQLAEHSLNLKNAHVEPPIERNANE